MANKIFEPIKFGGLELKNRIVMAPMTRCRAINNIPNDLMAIYYGQRAAAGLIVTEGTSPSLNGLGYCRIPGIFSDEQIIGWKKVADAVHEKGAKMFVQLMHTGRIGHVANLPNGARLLAPSAVKAAGQIWTDTEGMQDHSEPEAMTKEELIITKNEFVSAAKNAVKAGLDGVELHAANGYLLEQFLSPYSNIREDEYGGSIENRCRFIVETAQAVVDAIGKDKVGIRVSPYGVASDMKHYPEIDQTYTYLAEKLNEIGIAYIHVVDHSAMGAPSVPKEIKSLIKSKFSNTLILSGGYNLDAAEEDLINNNADLVAFGRPFINNPDLVDRLKNSWDLSNNLDANTFYSPGEQGYIDYPFYK